MTVNATNRRSPLMPLLLLAASLAATIVADPGAQAPANAERSLRGSWSAAGRIQTLPTETGKPAAVVQLSGAVVLADDTGAHTGFHGDAISFDDGSGVATGRAVWTDTRGDRLFSILRGEPIGTGRHVVGTITGGTGRYAGVAGGFELTWQYVISDDEGTIQGRTNDLRLRYGQKDRRP